MSSLSSDKLKLVVPTGRLQEKILALLESIGIEMTLSSRSYRPLCSDPDIEVKFLKPQNIPAMVALGRHDCGFSGFDWVLENGLLNSPDLSMQLDLGFNPVKIIAAVPEELAKNDQWKSMKLVVASEYSSIAQQFIKEQNLNAVFIKSYGATEALPPEDADMIIDNTSTGATLRGNHLEIVAEVLRSTTQFFAGGHALANSAKAEKLAEMKLLMQSTLSAQKRVMLEMNVPKGALDALVQDIPCMSNPTIAPLYGDNGFAVKVAVTAKEVPPLIIELHKRGAKDIVEYKLEKLVP